MTFIMGLLIVGLALWGVGDYFTQSSNDTVATVNGEIISYTDYNSQLANYRQNLMSQFGEGFDPSYFDSPQIRRGVLDSMINSELVRQVAHDNGFTVTADEIRQTIEEAPAFKDENGQFDKTLYAAFLSQTNQSAQLLQMKIAEEQAGQALNGMFDESSFVTPYESQKMVQLNKQTRDVEYITITPAKFSEGIEVTDEEIEAYYQDNSDRYMTEEMVSVNYIELEASALAESLEVTEEDALTYYEDNKQRFERPEQRKAAHILVNAGDDAEQTLQEIQDKLQAGEDFAELAKTYSQDPGSGSAGGDLGWVSPGDMVEEFDAALFAMDVNTVTEPVETQFGFHLIQLNEIKAGEVPLYEEVKADIIQELQAVDSEGLFLEKASELSELVLDAQSGLEGAAEASGYEMKTTELFARSGGAGIASNQPFTQAAFSPTVKDELLNSDVVNITDTHVAFLHLNELKAAELKPLEEVKETIVAAIKNEKAVAAAKALADTIAAEASAADVVLADVAQAHELEALTAEKVGRTGSSLPFNLVKNIFDLGRPAAGEVTTHVVDGNGNEVVVLRLLAVNEGDVSEDTDLATETAQLSRNVRNNEQLLLIQALRESASITINEDLLNQVNNL